MPASRSPPVRPVPSPGPSPPVSSRSQSAASAPTRLCVKTPGPGGTFGAQYRGSGRSPSRSLSPRRLERGGEKKRQNTNVWHGPYRPCGEPILLACLWALLARLFLEEEEGRDASPPYLSSKGPLQPPPPPHTVVVVEQERSRKKIKRLRRSIGGSTWFVG